MTDVGSAADELTGWRVSSLSLEKVSAGVCLLCDVRSKVYVQKCMFEGVCSKVYVRRCMFEVWLARVESR